MSNKKPKFEEITEENKKDFEDQFCKSVGHSNDCVRDTVEHMADMLQAKCKKKNLDPNDILKEMSVEDFDAEIRLALNSKACNCGRPEYLS